MFVSPDLIYLQMQKTGGTHITKILSGFTDGAVEKKHDLLTYDPGDRLVLTSIRNPWDWYVSLWSYGCMRNGGVYQSLTRDFYRQYHNPTYKPKGMRRQWLRLLRYVRSFSAKNRFGRRFEAA